MIKRHKSLRANLEDLHAHRQSIEASDPIAPTGVWIEVYRPVREIDYAQLQAETAMWGKSRMRGLKRVGSDWQNHIRRRDALLEIERRSRVLQTMIDTPIWES